MSEKIAVRILLPVDEVIFGLNLQRVSINRRSRMRRGSETDHLRPEGDQSIVPVDGLMMQSNFDWHEDSSGAKPGEGKDRARFGTHISERLSEFVTFAEEEQTPEKTSRKRPVPHHSVASESHPRTDAGHC
jgi:hypothetical protein